MATFKEYVTFEEVYYAYLDCLRHKKMTANAAIFQVNLYENLYNLYLDLNKGTYCIGKSITFIVDKPVKREVFAADFRDRIVHHIIINRLMIYFESEVIDNSFSCRVGKGTLCAIKTLEKEAKELTCNYTKVGYVMKCDLKSFFMTISKHKLYEVVSDLVKRRIHPNDIEQQEFLCSLIKLVIYNCPQHNCIRKQSISKWYGLPKEKSLFNLPDDYGLPIGNLTSQIFANYFLNEFDHYIYNVLGFKYYGRYVDDFYILSESKEKLLESVQLIKDKLNEIGVKLHPKKFYLQELSRGVTFVGGIVKPNRTYVMNRTINNFKVKIREFNNIKKINDEKLSYYVSCFNSYFGFLKHHNTFKIRKRLIKRMNNFKKYGKVDKKLTKIVLYKRV